MRDKYLESKPYNSMDGEDSHISRYFYCDGSNFSDDGDLDINDSTEDQKLADILEDLWSKKRSC